MKLIERVRLTPEQQYDPEQIRRELRGIPLAAKAMDDPEHYTMLFTLISQLFVTSAPYELRSGYYRSSKTLASKRFPGLTALVVSALEMTRADSLSFLWAGKDGGKTYTTPETAASDSATVLFPLCAKLELKPGIHPSVGDNVCRFGEVLISQRIAHANERVAATRDQTAQLPRNTVRYMDFLGIDLAGSTFCSPQA